MNQKKGPFEDFGHDENEWGTKDDSEKIQGRNTTKEETGRVKDDEI